MLLNEHHIAISGGLDELKGRIFRVGHMGKAHHADYIDAFLGVVRAYLEMEGFRSACRGKSCLASTSGKPAR
jgi:aspartate aminotransferase-like enzyme